MKKILPIALSVGLLALTGCGMSSNHAGTKSNAGSNTRILGTADNGTGYQGYFTDVQQGQWYTTAVEWAKDSGMLNGMPTGEFQPNKPMTRAEVASLLQKMASQGYIVVNNGANTTPATPAPTTQTPATPAPATPAPTTDTGTGTTPAPTTDTGTGTTPAPTTDTGTGTTPAPTTGTGTGTTPAPTAGTGTGTTPAPTTGTTPAPTTPTTPGA